MAATSLPSGYSAPIAVITDDDHSGWILITNALGLCFVLMALAMRVYIRTTVSPPFRADDFTLVVTTAFAVIQASLSFLQVNKGFGKSQKLLSDLQMVEIQKVGFASNIFYLITLYLSKITTFLLILRITPDELQQKVLNGSILACGACGVLSILVATLRCDLGEPWLVYGKTCTGLFARWQAVAALDIVFEVVLFLAPLYLLYGLQMQLSRKVKVLIAFSCRIPVIAIALARLYQIRHRLDSSDPTLVGAIVAIWTQVEVHYGTIASTIPCINPFLVALSTDFGAIGTTTVMNKYGSGSGSRTHGTHTSNTYSHPLQSLNHSRNKDADEESEDTDRDMKLRPDQSIRNVQAIITSGKRTSQADQQSVDSDNSTQLIIKKSVGWTISSETGAADEPVAAERDDITPVHTRPK